MFPILDKCETLLRRRLPLPHALRALSRDHLVLGYELDPAVVQLDRSLAKPDVDDLAGDPVQKDALPAYQGRRFHCCPLPVPAALIRAACCSRRTWSISFSASRSAAAPPREKARATWSTASAPAWASSSSLTSFSRTWSRLVAALLGCGECCRRKASS